MDAHKGDQEAHLSGAIKHLEFRNFMNHENLTTRFGRNINFIVGVNGSGKSAILTGLTLVLGGQVRSTGRKDFIKDGEEEGRVSVIISNVGADAFRPDVYGDSIRIQRHFKKSGNTWKTSRGDDMSDPPRAVKTSATEVRQISEHFNFQVDNPIAVLNQDMTKKFMQSSTKSGKYDLFEKGTKIDVIRDNYTEVDRNAFRIGKGTREGQAHVEALAKECQEAEREWEQAKKLRDMEDKVKLYEGYCAWRHIFDLEDKMEATNSKMEQAMEEKTGYDLKADTAGKKAADHRAKAVELEKESRNLDRQVEDLGRQTKELQAAKKNRTAIEKRRKRMEATLEEHKKRHHGLESERANVVATAEERGNRRRQEYEGKVSGLEEKLSAVQAEFSAAENGFYRSREAVDGLGRQAEAAARSAKEAKDKADSAKMELDAVKGASKDRLAPYGRDIRALYNAVQKERGWSGSPPVGPIGLHIQPKETKWVPAIEFCVGKMTSTFIVDNDRDRIKLQKIGKAVSSRWLPQIVVKRSEPRYVLNDRPDMRLPVSDAVLCENAVTIDNDQVYNYLIDSTRIHQTALFADNMKCKKWTDTDPRNLYQSLTTTRGKAIPTFDARTRSRWFVDKQNHRSVIAKDVSSLVSHRKEQYERLNKIARDQSKEASDVSKRATSAKRDVKDYEKKKSTLERQLEKLEGQLHGLRATNMDNEDDVSAEVSQLEEEMTQTVVEIEDTQAALDTVLADEIKLRAAEKPLQDQAAAAKDELDKCMVRSESLQNDLAAAKEAEMRQNTKKKRAESNAKKVAEEIEVLKADVMALSNKTQEQISAAEQLAIERPVRKGGAMPDHSVAWFQTKVEKMKKVLAKQSSEGDSMEAAATRLKNLRALYEDADDAHLQNKQLHAELEKTLMTRKSQLKTFQQYVGLKARQNFKQMVKARSFEGRLHIDHKKREIDILVDTSGKAKNHGPDKASNAQFQSVVGLSGGEKSFSNACFVTSMWEAMDCPLRCMDEYDVFMDAMNRTVTTKMLIDLARQQPHRQFVFLSPLGMKALKNLNETHEVEIIGLQDPSTMKGQTTLNFAAT